ncbi:MAG: YIP1 family protein [Clostridia bacterium]|nr:YIP1 family protein [Clostridia bacterium]
MKSRLSKILILLLIFVMIFGTLCPSAYEPYDTYTYSIDGEPLKSPSAYTPAPTAHNAGTMGLHSGYNWRYEDGVVATWDGDMTPNKTDLEFVVADVILGTNDEFVGVGYAVDEIAAITALIEAVKAYVPTHNYVFSGDGTDDTVRVTVSFGGNDIADGTTVANLASGIDAKLAEKEAAAVAAATGADAAKIAVTVSLDEASVIARCVTLFGYDSDVNLEIPATYEDSKGIIHDTPFIQADAFNAGNDAVKAAFYSKISGALIIGKEIASIGANAFASVGNISALYYEDNSSSWKAVNIADGNSKVSSNSAKKYYYSATVKFGNDKVTPIDIASDSAGNLYMVDQGTADSLGRVIILDANGYKTKAVIRTWVDEYGNAQNFKDPTGLCVTDKEIMADGSANIFVCDRAAKRIVVFDAETYEYVRTINQPESALLGEETFSPYAVAVDKYGRIFVVSQSSYEGVIMLSGEGQFSGFIGAQKTTSDPFEALWQKFVGTDNIDATIKNFSKPFNNIAVTAEGLVYVTINFDEPDDMAQQLAAIKSKESAYSPVKLLNSTGVEIMKRNGFFDPGGEVDIFMADEVSQIKDIAIGENGAWTILDTSRGRTFTYDSNGNLLFAFGDKGSQVGNVSNVVKAFAYQTVPTVVTDSEGNPVLDDEGNKVKKTVYNLVVLDSVDDDVSLTVYQPTEYYGKIMSALGNENAHDFDAAIRDWQNVLTSNNNFDLAYIGIGKALYNKGDYEGAMEYLSNAYETEYYSKAFANARKDILSIWMIPMVIVIIALVVLLFKFLGYAKKKNKATSLKVGRKSYVEELLYVFHLIFHPFDGFWDLKHEKRGSVRAASTILAITVAAFFYQAIGQGYMFNPRGDYSTVFMQVIAVVVPVMLWIISNWCLTTLFDGEGSFRDIYIATCYSLAPLPFFVILSTILSNVFTATEGSTITLLVAIGYVWVGLLLFFGMAVTHDYSNGKNFITVLGTIVAMAVIMFIAILFSSLVIKMVTFVVSLISEIGNRF